MPIMTDCQCQMKREDYNGFLSCCKRGMHNSGILAKRITINVFNSQIVTYPNRINNYNYIVIIKHIPAYHHAVGAKGGADRKETIRAECSLEKL